MRFINLCLCALCCCISISVVAQVSYTANQHVTPYTKPFRPGVNMGYYPGWDNQSLADVAAGNVALNIPGVGAKSNRVGLLEYVMDYFGYDLVVNDFHHWNQLGMGEYVAFVGGPTAAHRDTTQYCPDRPSYMFANLYTPIWDGGANGTPYNDTNYCAAYFYKVVNQYKGQVRFWEIWNEPGYDFTGNLGYRDQNYPGNWWLEGPNPCDNILQAPIYNYTRTLRIAWEIIKTLDPDAYVCLGSVAFPSFMNALLRNTDNPHGGDVTPEYPLGGGAYFDCIAIHSYPHFDGSTVNPDVGLFERHSDQAADGVTKAQTDFQAVLDQYGYDGIIYPRKEWISTEINSPRKALTTECFAGHDQQINHMMKAQMIAKVSGIRQLHAYQLFDEKTEVEATDEFQLMGMYAKIDSQPAYNQVVNDLGKAMKTMTDLVFDAEYDAQKTASLQLPANVRGYAWRRPDGTYIYALWARTTVDQSEAATATYSLPTVSQTAYCLRYAWDYGYTNVFDIVSPTNLQLTARPLFFVVGQGQPPCYLFANTTATQCFDNNTSNNLDDDTYTLSLTITGLNTSGQWTATVGDHTLQGAVGATVELGPYTISEGALTGVVKDATSSTCATEFSLVPPAPCSAPVPYCATASEFPWHDWIAGVDVAAIHKTSSKTAYSDFTDQEATLTAGNQYPLELTAGFSWLTYDEYWRVWIDFNQNGIFESNEVAFEGVQSAPPYGIPSGLFNGFLNIPANAIPGDTRMRVSMKRGAFAEPCETIPYGEVEDYSIQIMNNNTGGGDPVPYCTAQSDFPWHDWIARVQMGSLDNTSGKTTYSDFTNVITRFQRGESVNFTLTSGFSWETFDEHWSVWIDYNQNGLFEAPAERVYTGLLPKPASGTALSALSGNFIVPANATFGPTRMRIIMGRTAQTSACSTLPFGEIEDYTVSIISQQSLAPTSAAANRTAINSTALQDIRIYPNPATNYINIDLAAYSGQEGMVRIYNAQGQRIMELRFDSDSPATLHIPMVGYANGTYVVQVQLAGTTVAKRIAIVAR